MRVGYSYRVIFLGLVRFCFFVGDLEVGIRAILTRGDILYWLEIFLVIKIGGRTRLVSRGWRLGIRWYFIEYRTVLIKDSLVLNVYTFRWRNSGY